MMSFHGRGDLAEAGVPDIIGLSAKPRFLRTVHREVLAHESILADQKMFQKKRKGIWATALLIDTVWEGC